MDKLSIQFNFQKLILFILFVNIVSLTKGQQLLTATNISYTDDTQNERQQLDIYYKATDTLRNVIIFIHGGEWDSGKLTPTPIDDIAQDCTDAVKWVKKNIYKYGGDPNCIFLMGHSAGGHLVAYINSNPKYFNQFANGAINVVRGAVLLDTFGIDMYEYLCDPTSKYGVYYNTFITVFSNDSDKWKQASPITYWNNIQNPQLILLGNNTYPIIQKQNRDLYQKLTDSHLVPVELYNFPNRDHPQMVIYLFVADDDEYNIILPFIQKYEKDMFVPNTGTIHSNFIVNIVRTLKRILFASVQ